MDDTKQWITPFLKQCFVTTAVSLNVASNGLVLGFAAALLEQLKVPGSAIPIDDSSGSWIASIPALFLVVGNFLVIPIMEKYGRRSANLISIALLIIGWLGVIFASSVTELLISRSLQGVCIGMTNSIAPLLIGEYTSPENRGGFLMTISVSISASVFSVHTIGAYVFWRTGAMIFIVIALINSLILFLSPESPSWLASQGRYEECKKVFRWLRGDGEEEELSKMIEASVIVRESKLEANVSEAIVKRVQKSIVYFNTTVKRREFYRPLVIMIHIYTLSIWGGVNIIIAYAAEYFRELIGHDADTSLLIVTLDGQRVISNIFAIYIIKKIRRKPMLLTTVGLNITALLAISAYNYARIKQTLPFDHPIIPILLNHCMMFGIATGSISLPFVIAGEIFPLEFKSLAGGISMLTYSANMFLIIKTVPFCFVNFGVHGTLCISALILSFCLAIAWILLPETKDRTLQDIEDEFRGRPLSEVLKSAQPLINNS